MHTQTHRARTSYVAHTPQAKDEDAEEENDEEEDGEITKKVFMARGVWCDVMCSYYFAKLIKSIDECQKHDTMNQ